jgi:beta-mannosidase
VHLDLQDHNLIPDPYYGKNNEEVRWIETMVWEYKTAFIAPQDFLSLHIQELVFEGLDTFAEIKLNDKLLGRTDNFFRPWEYDVKGFLNGVGEINTLHITFTPVFNRIDEVRKSMEPKTLPENWAYIRKPPFHFGWDWGPRMVTCGIYKPVYLRGFSFARIVTILFRNDEITDYDKLSKINIFGHVDLLLSSNEAYILRIHYQSR